MKKTVKKQLIIFCVLIFLISLVGYFLWGNYFDTKNYRQLSFINDQNIIKIKIGDKVLNVEIVNTDKSREQGLSDRTEIGSDGMLFVFEQTGIHGFWMKKMKFNLDFIWINNNKVVDITKNIKAPDSEKKLQFLDVYKPSEPVNMMLEVVGGKTNEWQINIGDKVSL